MTDKEKHRLHLQELEALDDKRMQDQQQIELYQAWVFKAFNKKVREQIFKKRWPYLSCQKTHDYDT